VTATAQPAPTPSATAPSITPSQPAAAPAGTRIVIKATADAWITVKQKAGPALLNKLMHAGDVFAVPADKTGLALTTGNAGGTELDVDGAPVPGLGASGMVRRNLPLDPDALKAGNLPPVAAPRPKPAGQD
jgi:cytoskeleton protein RodZ